jgi:hypothetical protein
MRGTHWLSLLLLLPLGAACAASNPAGTGGSGTTSSSGRPTTSSTGSSMGCGLTSSDAACLSCFTASCCNEASACAGDATCTGCLTSQTAACDSDAPFTGLIGCLQTFCNSECLGGGATSGGGTTTGGGTTGAGGSTGGVPTTCAEANNDVGCCDPSGVLHYCTQQMTVADQPCTGGTVCGWDPTHGWYDCVAPPGGADPSNQNPIACGGGGGGTGGGTTSSTTTTGSGGGGGVTWTQLYNGIFGPSGTSSCVAGGGCHTVLQGGFKCGTSKSSCYNGIVGSGLVTTGAQAPSSVIADPAQSPLCGSLGGNMPKGGTCVTSTQIQQIKSWLADGAPNN